MRHTDVCQCHDYVNHDARTMTYRFFAVTVNQLEQQLLVLAVTGCDCLTSPTQQSKSQV